MEACSNCKFYITGPWVSTCRRYPTYVERKPTDWCGQYEKVDVPESRNGVPEVKPMEQPVKPKGRPKKNV